MRGVKMKFYPGCWNGISGFLDDGRSVREKAKEEVHEEVGVAEEDIIAITEGKVFEQDEPEYDKIWIVHPVLVRVHTDKIKLDWEAQDYQWVAVDDARKFNLLPGFEKVLKVLFSQ